MNSLLARAADLRSKEIVEKYHYGIDDYCDYFSQICELMIGDFLNTSGCIDDTCVAEFALNEGNEVVEVVNADCNLSLSIDDEQDVLSLTCSPPTLSTLDRYIVSQILGTQVIDMFVNGTSLINKLNFTFPYNVNGVDIPNLIEHLTDYVGLQDASNNKTIEIEILNLTTTGLSLDIISLLSFDSIVTDIETKNFSRE